MANGMREGRRAARASGRRALGRETGHGDPASHHPQCPNLAEGVPQAPPVRKAGDLDLAVHPEDDGVRISDEDVLEGGPEALRLRHVQFAPATKSAGAHGSELALSATEVPAAAHIAAAARHVPQEGRQRDRHTELSQGRLRRGG